MKSISILACSIAALAVSSQAFAQGVWVGECTAAKKCAAVADPPAQQAGAPALTTCTLNGMPGGSMVKPLVAKSTVPANIQAAIPAMKDPTCFWPDLVIPAGNYSLTASIQDASGRSSGPSDPPIAVTILTPLAPPSVLRLLQQ
jgi:hypothetical protein